MRSRGAAGEGGFTLIELIVTMSIVSIVMGTLSMAIIVGLRTTDETTRRLADSHDLQLLSIYLPADAQSAVEGRIDTSAATAIGCTPPDPSGTNVLHLAWDEPGGTQTFRAAYRLEGVAGENVLARYSCVNAGTLRRVVVAHGLGSSGTTATYSGRSITMNLVLASGLTTSITANRRTPGAVPPGLVVTFPVNSDEYNNAGWNAGCSTAGVCGTATDSVGIQKVEVAVLRVATSQYWNGSTFGSASPIYNPASGTTTWTYGFAAASFPAEGSYAVTVKVTNNLGTEATASRTFVIDRTAPTTTDDTAAIGSAWKNTDQTVTLVPIDTGGAGVAATHYTTNGTNPTTASTTGNSIALTTEGSFTVKYFSRDGAGNQESVKTAATAVRIDKTAPTAAALTAPPAAIKNGHVLEATGTDALSGIAGFDFFYCAGISCTPTTSIGSASGSPATLAWNGQPADGPYQLLVRAKDAAGNALDSAKRDVTIDNTAPTVLANSIVLANGTGSAKVGTADQGDTLTVGFSEALKASTICSSWTSDSAEQTLNGDNQVVVTITENGANDTLSLAVTGCTFRFGPISLGADYVSATATYKGTGSPAAKRSSVTWDPTARTIQVKLGEQVTGTVRTGVLGATVTYTPDSGLTDIVGNPLATSAVSSTGTSRF